MNSLSAFIEALPKAELHLHIEGSLEPELLFELAARNKVELNYPTIDALKNAYQFSNLQEFLNIYYEGMKVLQTEDDFYDLTFAYFARAKKDNVRHVELFFDAQMHMNNGIDFDIVINGIYQATLAAFEAFNISSKIILGILRDLSEEAAFDVLKKCVAHQDKIIGIGLNSAEKGHPPQKFERVFAAAREQGFLTVAHAGEEGPADYIWQAINLLKVRRIDHGNHAIDDNELLAFLKKQQIPLTMCPLSNLKLKVVDDLKNHPAKLFLDKGLMVTINSDDPAYFGGYISENYSALQKALDLSTDDLITLAQNSFNASFITKAQKRAFLGEIDDVCDEYSSLTGF